MDILLKTSTITFIINTNLFFEFKYLYEVISHDVRNHISKNIYYVAYKTSYEGIHQKRNSKHKKSFLNQISLGIYINSVNNKKLELMIFKNVIKMNGCTCTNDAVDTIIFLWIKYISRPKCFIIINERAKFIFEEVMINKSFVLPYKIFKENFNEVMNKYYTNECISFYEPSTRNSISIEMTPTVKNKNIIIIEELTNTQFEISTTTIEKKSKGSNFMIFEENVIISGSNIVQIYEDYEFVKRILIDHKKEIEI